MLAHRKLITLLAVTLTSLSPAFAGIVNMDRMLREHKVYVVTTESQENLNRYWIQWRPRDVAVMSIAEFYINRNRLTDGAFVFWIINRARTRMIPEEEALLPCPTSGIGSSEVLVYASKTGNKRSECRRGRWDVLISAPNQKWLHNELERLQAGFLSRAVDERGAVLDRYNVRRVCIVSTEGRQVAEDWVGRQSRPGQDAIDWEFVSADSWTADSDTGTDLLFILNADVLGDRTASVTSALPDDARAWLAGNQGKDECSVVRRDSLNSSGQPRTVAAVIGACARQLRSMLGRYTSLDNIPEALTTSKLTDLSPFQRVVVVARPGDRALEGRSPLVDDLAGKITSVLSSEDLGFQCESRQDLKELIYESLRRGEGDIDRRTATEIRSKMAGACALVVADLSAVNAQTSYAANAPQCTTPTYPAFGEAQPSRPHEPDPHERKYGFIGPRIYPEGANDPKFRERYRRWREEMEDYEHEMRRWEARKRDYEERRWYHEMEWVASIDSIQRADITGNLRVYDLSAFEDSNTSAGRVVYSCPLKGSCERRGSFRSERVVVRGENAHPGTPNVPQAEDGVLDQTIISEALLNACRAAVGGLADVAILPRDRPGASQTVASVTTTTRGVHLRAEALGAIKLRRKPLGDGIDVARQAALHDAYPKLVYNVRQSCPEATVADEEVRDRARIVSEGWDSASSEYRVRVSYENESIARAPGAEVVQ